MIYISGDSKSPGDDLQSASIFAPNWSFSAGMDLAGVRPVDGRFEPEVTSVWKGPLALFPRPRLKRLKGGTPNHRKTIEKP